MNHASSFVPSRNSIPSHARPLPFGALKISQKTQSPLVARSASDSDFDFAQRIESTKAGLLGLLAGGFALAPFAALDDVLFGRALDGLDMDGVAQWEFDTDMGSIQGALFAIVYRYCVREDTNPMLNQGVVGAFVLVRTLPRVIVPNSCSAVPLRCGEPLGYFNWGMLGQSALGFVESAALFGAVAFAMDYCFEKKLIDKFRS
eukprot:CAMPEP_0113305020 /NCGR_PEP_ID=MMETSP0010_2-20120614/4800_1 /TAXON_ID=216773 ORGANISM="Corethron hystrix, Strain 308" /NCGR_SAMPLE_ID=MMETSP0010_2 /ASSEMBLY_ACC=CAM_ASM_000155 /LENGTH=202 /DNA_ID=CAMNT_0000159327 /DNA_START=167 /DNA_END=775 /DNA_ORIENTATION=+ /assembly_acc=CAM_ASM_000155